MCGQHLQVEMVADAKQFINYVASIHHIVYTSKYGYVHPDDKVSPISCNWIVYPSIIIKKTTLNNTIQHNY